jgi:pimeloyl-ACP methyl ester carboxylesterase
MTTPASTRSGLAFARTGRGEPLVLLHALGLSRSVWDPVLPALAQRFDVVAVDLPGFGHSPLLPPGVEPTPAALARAVAELLEDLGVEAPHVVGNSLGGWVALELAAVRPVASVTLLSPAGLWRADTPLYCRMSLRATRWLSRHATGVLTALVASRAGRGVVFGQTLGHPSRMTAGQARAAIASVATSPGFDAAFSATLRRHYQASTPIDAPVTVAFGSRDRLLLRHQSRSVAELPSDTHVVTLPEAGHVPMTDDPRAVAALIAASTARASRGC